MGVEPNPEPPSTSENPSPTTTTTPPTPGGGGVDKPKRKFSGNSPPESSLGKTNLSFVLEESEDEDGTQSPKLREISKQAKQLRKQHPNSNNGEIETNSRKTSTGSRRQSLSENNNNVLRDGTADGGIVEVNQGNKKGRNGESNWPGSSAVSNNGNGTVTLGSGGADRRRSSAEVIRQSRAYKRISKALSQISLYTNNQPKEQPVYTLQGINEDEVLEKFFELFDTDKKQELDQSDWIYFLRSRLTREHKDFVDLVESVASSVCGDANVKFEQFCRILRAKNVLNGFYRLIDRESNGVVSVEQIMEFISALSSARSNNGLTKENIQRLEQLFRQYVVSGNEIRKEDFKRIIQTKNQFFTDRVFDIFDRDGSGSISLHEFVDAMHDVAGQNPDDRLRFLFKIYDVDGDGFIQCEELDKVIRACMDENGMEFSDDQIRMLTTALFEDADVDKQGSLTYDALKAQLQKHDGLLENLSISMERWLVPPAKKEPEGLLKDRLRKLKPHQFSRRYFKNNYVYVIWLLVYIFTNVSLFISKAVGFWEQYPTSTVFLVIARGAGQCLNFNSTFIVIAMLRQCLTYLRARGASAIFPIDKHIYFHKMTGQVIFMFSLLHTIMHLINIEIGILPSSSGVNVGNWTYLQFLFDPRPSSQPGLSLGLIPGYAFNTGVLLMIILSLMVICSLPFVRQGGCFEVFYWTHLLYYLYWILLIIHAPNFWKWFIVPGVIFLIEQVLRFFNWRMGRGRTSVSSGMLLPSKVTHLVIRRPPNFEFRPGDYVFVRIPQIAKYEWHPFTISSAPEQPDAIWLHIRAVGQWTTRLFEYFENEQVVLASIANQASSSWSAVERSRINTALSNYSELQENSKPFNGGLSELELVLGPETRARLPTVGLPDSHETIDPTSSSSSSNTSNNPSLREVFSSVDTISEQDAMIKEKKLPIRTRPRPSLVSTKSLPNVHERIKKRELKFALMESPKAFQRSHSVSEVESPSEGSVGGSQRTCQKPSRATISFPNVLASRNNRVPQSLRYMRNKPTIISLKTPSYEGQASGKDCGDKMCEEGKANGNLMIEVYETEDGEGSELHPIIGTTRTGQGSLATGRPLEIYLDGPYGAPSSHIFRAEHAVLIATGIGVTPFASILQSIMHRYWATRQRCPKCNFTWCGELPQSVLHLKKVDFFWINRDQRSFEWFVHLLSQLEIEQAELGGAMERFLDMHMFITSALQKTDMKAVGLQLALDLLHEREKRDLITGLKTKTHAGRPNWSKVFQQIANQKKGKVTVFYCGPPALARTLKIKCDEFGFSFRKELF